MVALHLGPVQAQVVRGQVVDSITTAPVGAGFVVLLGADDEEITRVLASWDGRFTFHVSPDHRGPFRLRSERIGYRVAETEPFDAPTSGTTDLTLWVAALPTPLSAIEVRGTTQCKLRPREDEQTSVVWEEARKALAAASWTASRQLYHVVSNIYDRDMDRRRRRVRSERHRPSIGFSTNPFVSRDPDELVRDGYVVQESGTVVYFAPDAHVLQSEGFLETHCFRLRVHDRDGDNLIGVAFEPAPSRDLPDVEGVLWLDRQSSELRSLEFRFTRLPYDLRDVEPPGGTVEFMPLPSGAWIVYRWHITLPTVRTRVIGRGPLRRTETIVESFREAGGEVLNVTDRRGELVYQAELAELTGVVIDSTRGVPRPLVGATVRIAGTWFEGTTDHEGRFRVGAPLNGEYDVTVTHPRTDSLRFTPTPRSVTLARGRADTLSLAIPPLDDILRSLCPDEVPGPADRVVLGTVRDTAGRRVPDVEVAAVWQRRSRDRGLWHNQTVVVTDDDGNFTLCSLQPDHAIMVYAVGHDARSELAGVAFEAGGTAAGQTGSEVGTRIQRRDLVLHANATVTVLAGLVTDAATGKGIPGAIVRLAGAADSSTTDSLGMFQVDGLSTGRHRLGVWRPGYSSRAAEVSVEADQPTIVRTESLALTPAAQVDGTMTELETNRPLVGVWVTLVSDVGDSVARFWSDSAGKFLLTAPAPGPYYVAARRLGYAPQTLGPFQLRMGHAVEVEVPLRPLVVGLEPITVIGEAPVRFLTNVGFYERRARRPGVFLDREAIEKRAAASAVGDLLRGMPGVRVDGHGRIRLRYFGSCDNQSPVVWIDGMRIPQGTAKWIDGEEMFGRNSPLLENWQDFVEPSSIEAIEVYRGPSEVPVQYSAAGVEKLVSSRRYRNVGSACGVILIWMRH
jgi:hypothetical protein